jgi:hypothetical protein
MKRFLNNRYIHTQKETQEESQQPFLRDMIKTSINSKKDGSSLHFPFLVMEAKAENSHEGFDHAEVQSGLPIIAALKCQYEMMKIAANTVEVPGGPLVWFLANRGEHWRLYAAYVVEDQGQEPSFVSLFSIFKGRI